jgi:RNA-splicing ligase RtcB
MVEISCCRGGRASDRSKSRDRKDPKTKDERLKERDEMKARRDNERLRMEEAREKRKNIDSRIREKMAATQEFRI